MVKLSRLVVNRFRNIRPGTTLKFRNGLNVLLGRNGSGKTTLLELISAAVTMDFSPLRNEAYDLKFDAQFDADEVEAHVVSTPAPEGGFQRALDLKLKPHVEGADNLIVRVRDSEMTIERNNTVIYDGPASFDGTKRPGMATLLDLVRQVASRGTLNQARTLVAASRLARARRFDEALDHFQTVIGDTAEIYLMPAEDGELVGISFMVPDWIIDVVAAQSARQSEGAFQIDVSASPTFARLLPRLHARSASVLIEPVDEAPGGAKRFRCTRLILEHADGSRLDQTQLCFGQKRLLAFFWYLAASPHVVVADELTNGLDYQWVDLCLTEIGARQCFLSASHPLLVERLRLDTGEDVRRSFTLCQEMDRDTRPELVWEQLHEKSANAFFRSWKGGVQEFGELLRSKGLW
jgi:ABC-type lipoprotein export system ATPase subunit